MRFSQVGKYGMQTPELRLCPMIPREAGPTRRGYMKMKKPQSPPQRISLSIEKTTRHVNIMREKDYTKGANIEGMLNGEVTKLV